MYRMPKEHIKQKLLRDYPPEYLQRWYDPLLLKLQEHTYTLEVYFPHAYFERWFTQEGKRAFEQAFHDWCSTNMPQGRLCYCPFSGGATPEPFFQAGTSHIPAGDKHNDFSCFITNTKNAFPLAAAREVANPKSAHKYNPFVICGKNGTGKTHILRAIATERGLSAPNKPGAIFFADVDGLYELFANNTTTSLLARYTCIIIDDIQRLSSRMELQDQLAKFMDCCQEQGLQMVFACTGTISAIAGMSEALRFRLEAGLVVDLKPADIEVRMRFTQKRCAEYNIKVDKNHCLLLAQRCTQLSQLSGILLKIRAFHDLVQRDVTLEDIENILRSTGDERQTLPTDIVDTVAHYTGQRIEDILGSKRKPELVMARQISMYLCRELLGTSYPMLGRFFGGKDHSTVIHSIQKINKLLLTNKDTQQMVAVLKLRCQGR